MSEKWSERDLREQKIETLKGRLLGEVGEALEWRLLELRSLPEESIKSNRGLVREILDEAHDLYALEDYLKKDSLFMGFHNVYLEQDVAFFKVHGETLDWMLQNEDLLPHIMFTIRRTGLVAEQVLCEEFFEREVFSVMERVLFEKKQQEKESGRGEIVEDVLVAASERSKAAQIAGDNKNKDDFVFE